MFRFTLQGALASTIAYQNGEDHQLGLVTVAGSEYLRLRYGASEVDYYLLGEGAQATRVDGFSPSYFTSTNLHANLDELAENTGGTAFFPNESINENRDIAIGFADGDTFYVYTPSGADGTLEAAQITISTGAITGFSSAFSGAAPDLDYVTALAFLPTSGGQLLLAASETEDNLQTFQIENDGTLTAVNVFDADDEVYLNGVTDLAVFAAHGTNLVAAASPDNSGSILLFEAESNGELSILDHVVANTQLGYSGANLIESFSVDERVFLVTTGTNAMSLLEVLPTGQLLDVSYGLDRESIFSGNPTSLKAQLIGTELQLFLTVEGSDEIVQVSSDMSDIIAPGSGTATDQLVTALAGQAAIGGAGDDILLDGVGSETLTGGDGADIFVFRSDNNRDYITDFQLGVDKIDISALGLAYTLDALDFETLADGFSVSFGTEILEVRTFDGGFLNESDLDYRDLFNMSHSASILGEIGLPITEILGSLLSDTILGGIEDDTVLGFAGDDFLDGAGGADILFGGTGRDILMGGDGRDQLSGEEDEDRLYGGSDDDMLDGGDGHDRLVGESGNDSLYGGLGNDTFFGGDFAIVDLAAISENVVSGYYGQSYQSGTPQTSSSGSSDSHGATLFDLGGSDMMEPGAGPFPGADGDDSFDGGAGIDTLSYYHSSSGVRIDLRFQGTDQTAQGQSGLDVFTGIENVHGSNFGGDLLIGSGEANALIGFGGNDRLFGVSGNDMLFGFDGDDVLNGGAGADHLNGGAGDDIFDFDFATDSTASAMDKIFAFEQGSDRIDVTDIDANPEEENDQSFSFLGSDEFTGAGGELRVFNVDGSLIVQADVDGDMIADLQLQMDADIEMAESDFLL